MGVEAAATEEAQVFQLQGNRNLSHLVAIERDLPHGDAEVAAQIAPQ